MTMRVRPISRRSLLTATAGLGSLAMPWPQALAADAPSAAAASDDPPRLGFIGFELIDEQPDPSRAEEHRQRLALISRQMAEGLQARGLYQVLDLAPAAQALERARAENEFLYRCNGCLNGVGQALGTRRVGTGWVQRIGNLILNLNLQVQDVVEDRVLLTKSVDIRGDNDTSWQRGIAYMLRDMQERRQRTPGYGR